VLQILAIAGALQSVTANNHSAYLAAAKTHVPAAITGVFVVALVPLLFVFAGHGVVGVAFAHLGAMIAAVAVSVGLMNRYLNTSLRDLAQAAWRPFVAAAAMAIAVYWLDANHFGFDQVLSPYVRLILGLFTGVLLYVSLVAALWLIFARSDGVERALFERARAMLARST